MSRRGSAGWSAPRPIGGGVNTEGTENFPAFSPDGSTLVFVRDFEGFWQVSAAGV